MTPRQKEIYDWIVSETEKHRPPTIREIGKQFGIKNPNGVMSHLKELCRQGVLRLSENKARGIEVVDLKNKEALKDMVCQEAILLVSHQYEGPFEDQYAELRDAVIEYQAAIK